MNLKWLEEYSEAALGPIQQEEALFLFGLCRVVRPQRVLEFGSGLGASTRVWLEAGVPEVWTVDVSISDPVRQLAERWPNLKIIEGNMAKVELPKLSLDLVFFDGAHDFKINRAAWEGVKGLIVSGGVIAVHDTGQWAREHMGQAHQHIDVAGTDPYAHRPEERRYAVSLDSGGDDRLDFHSLRTLRHGISLFQYQYTPPQ